MKTLDFIMANMKYLANTEPGSIINTVRKKQPTIPDGETNADLHTHPRISSLDDFFDTVDILVKNNVDICAITTHVNEGLMEYDFWNVKEMIKKERLGRVWNFKDKGLAFEISLKDRTLTFVGAYEIHAYLKGVAGLVGLVALMPDKGFEKIIEEEPGLSFFEYSDLCTDYDMIKICTHPYTIKDPFGLLGMIRFRLADEKEREIIRTEIFPIVDCVDLVSTNCAWMGKSNELAKLDYVETTGKKPLSNSDAHSTDNYTRNEIGRAGNLFRLEPYATGDELREQLSEKIIKGDFRTYLNYMPALQFLLSIALHMPEEDFP